MSKVKIKFPNCFYCGKEMTKGRQKVHLPSDRTLDHVNPKSGHPKHGKTVEACRACNSDKGHLPLEEYRLICAYRQGALQASTMAEVLKNYRFWGEINGSNPTA